jgi:hypothetical protein
MLYSQQDPEESLSKQALAMRAEFGWSSRTVGPNTSPRVKPTPAKAAGVVHTKEAAPLPEQAEPKTATPRSHRIPETHRNEDEPVIPGNGKAAHAPATPKLKLYHECIYTIVHRDKLDGVPPTKSLSLCEGTRWTRGVRILEAAQREGSVVAVLFADACDCSELTHAALLKSARIEEKDSHIRIAAVIPIPRGRRPQELVSLGTGRTIAPGYIRPYVPCETPDWLPALFHHYLEASPA